MQAIIMQRYEYNSFIRGSDATIVQQKTKEDFGAIELQPSTSGQGHEIHYYYYYYHGDNLLL